MRNQEDKDGAKEGTLTPGESTGLKMRDLTIYTPQTHLVLEMEAGVRTRTRARFDKSQMMKGRVQDDRIQNPRIGRAHV